MLITRSRRGRRRLATVLALALIGAGATVLASASPAAALPCNPDTNPNCPPPPPTTWHSTLTVVPPSKGTIVGRDVATDALVYSCSAGGGTCSHTDSQVSADGRPDDGWPEYAFTLDAASAPGYQVSFSGACTGTITCTAANSANSATLTAALQDVQAPSVTISPADPGPVAPGTTFTATATDNDSVSSYAWWVCPVGGACGEALGTNQTFTLPGGLGAGHYSVAVRATDPSNNAGFAQSAITVPSTLTPAAATIKTTYGRAAALAVTVGPAGTTGATGTVRFTVGHAVLCTATVAAGRAKCPAPATVAAGRHTVTASYTGNLTPSQATFVLAVAKAATAIKVSVPRSVRHGARATVRITGLPRAATGVVTVARSGHLLCTARVRSGTASCRVAAPAHRGTYSLVATYRGDANHAGSHATARLRVT